MQDIVINFSILEKTLSKVVEKSYSHMGGAYLVIEEIRVQTEEIDPAIKDNFNFDYIIVGRYGVEDTNKDVHFELFANSAWDYSFLAGYFARIIDEKDENE